MILQFCQGTVLLCIIACRERIAHIGVNLWVACVRRESVSVYFEKCALSLALCAVIGAEWAQCVVYFQSAEWAILCRFVRRALHDERFGHMDFTKLRKGVSLWRAFTELISLDGKAIKAYLRHTYSGPSRTSVRDMEAFCVFQRAHLSRFTRPLDAEA